MEIRFRFKDYVVDPDHLASWTLSTAYEPIHIPYPAFMVGYPDMFQSQWFWMNNIFTDNLNYISLMCSKDDKVMHQVYDEIAKRYGK